MIYIGHLDLMRFFQKAVRRAGLPAAYSEGFSPHMLMSFAMPLGVGVSSTGEYVDIRTDETKEQPPAEEWAKRLNDVMVPGLTVLKADYVPDDKKNKAMSMVESAVYTLYFDPFPEEFSGEMIRSFSAKEEIVTEKEKRPKKQKKNRGGEEPEMIDIRPLLYSIEPDPAGGSIRMHLSAGSRGNLPPKTVMNALCAFAGIENCSYRVERTELCGPEGRPLLP